MASALRLALNLSINPDMGDKAARAGSLKRIAEMAAAKIYNERDGKPLPAIYGAVTTG